VPQRNVLGVVLDDSRSMRIRDVGSEQRVAAVERTFADSTALMRALAGRFALRYFRFGGAVTPATGVDGLTAAAPRTDLAGALRGASQELADAPVAGLIVVTDGADNADGDMDAALLALRARHIPVYTVGVGAERFARDIFIDRLALPATTLAGSGVLAQVAIGARGVRGDTTSLTVEADGRIVARQPVDLPAGRELIEVPVRIPPLVAGNHLITVRIAPLANELITENNRTEAVLRVRPAMEQVLYFEGQPRFEFGFLRRAFDGDSSVRLVGLLRSARGKFLRINVADSLDLLGGFPTRREDLFRYRALILGDVEASFFTGDQLRMIADFVDKRGGALIALGGRDALDAGGYAGTPVADVLPFTLESDGRASSDTATISLKVQPTALGLTHPALQLGPDPATNVARWDSLPPVTSVNHLGEMRAGAETLLVGHPLPRGATQPVLALQRYGRGESLVLGVQDTWLWKMNPATPLDDHKYETFWRQLVRWSLDQVPDRIDLAATPQHPAPGDAVTLRARVVDSVYNPANGAAVTADVTTPQGEMVRIPLDWALRDDGSYSATFAATDSGAYRYTVTAVQGTDTLRSAEAELAVDPRGADMDHAEQRTPLLQRIASETGGRYYPLNALTSLPEDVNITESGITAHESRDLWDMPAVLLLLIGLLAADWGYRRWCGLA
ncbi:MAG: hypothetical protein ACREL5_05090, partial [Gemmatimonadales bacterium]